MTTRDRILNEASKHVGVREKGHNKGFWVEKFLGAVGLGPGYAWCAAFVTYVLKTVDHPFGPKKGKAAVINWQRYAAEIGRFVNIQNAQAGDLFLWVNKNGTGHIGFMSSNPAKNAAGAWQFTSIEGNTNDDGSREGDGVYKRVRVVTSKMMFVRVA